MPSNAFADFVVLLSDAEELLDAQLIAVAGTALPQYGQGANNRAAVVMCVSSWEAYIERVIMEAVEAMRPAPGGLLTGWLALSVPARKATKALHAPDVRNVETLVEETLGLANLRASWFWPGFTPEQSVTRLNRALLLRHQVVHGLHPRPPVSTAEATVLPEFFRYLGRRTDEAIRDYLVNTVGVNNPWPA